MPRFSAAGVARIAATILVTYCAVYVALSARGEYVCTFQGLETREFSWVFLGMRNGNELNAATFAFFFPLYCLDTAVFHRDFSEKQQPMKTKTQDSHLLEELPISPASNRQDPAEYQWGAVLAGALR